MSTPTEEKSSNGEAEQTPAERTTVQPGPIKRLDRPDQDEEPNVLQRHATDLGIGREPGGVQDGIADADKTARSGTVDEPVRNTPPAGEWNETTPE